MSFKNLCAAGASIIALMSSSGAMAAGPETPVAVPTRTDPAGIGDIVVTAERRQQSVQKSSLAIEVLSSKAVAEAGVTQVRDLTKLVPGVQIGQGGPATQIYIRGVGDFGSTATTNPGVAAHVDGIYVARPTSIEGNFFDLERIEVVKGPQGTLYGRNATGGAINIITAKPKLGEFGGYATVEVGNYELVHATGALNVPIGDDLALRAAIDTVSRKGYSRQGFDDDHHQSYRLQALWQPTDDVTLRLSGDYTHIGGRGPAYVFKGPLDPAVQASLEALGVTVPTGKRIPVTDPALTGLYYGFPALAGLCIPNAFLATVSTSAGPATPMTGPEGFCGTGNTSLITQPDVSLARFNNKFFNISAELNWNLGFATLTALPGYRRSRTDYVTYPVSGFDNAPFTPEKSNENTLEVRLGNSTPKLTWVAGLYYFRERQSGDQTATPRIVIFGNQYIHTDLDTTSKAIFGQATYSVTDRLRVIGGLRYSNERHEIDGLAYNLATPNAGLPFAAGQPCYNGPSVCIRDRFTGDKTWNRVTYKTGVEFDLTPQNMLFVTYGTGIKAGGFNATSLFGTPNQAAAYGPEKLTALEVGARNRFFGNKLQLNLEVFHWKYRDAQAFYPFLDASGAPSAGVTNAGRSTMYGGNVDAVWRITANDQLRGSVEYLHTRFDSFVFPSSGQTPVTSGCELVTTGTGPMVDCSGKRLTRAPKWSGSAQYQHTFPLANGGSVDAVWSTQFATQRWGTVAYIPSVSLKGYASHDASITYHAPEDRWELTGFVRNLSNALIYTGAQDSGIFYPSLAVANLQAPRTFGARLHVNF
jgi:iron complex outermembrane receptor protein